MGLSLGSIVSDIKSAVTDPGKLVTEAANSILPGNMKAIGDMLGGLTDITSGNPLAALSHLTDALKDLPQLLQSLSGAAGGAGASKPAGTAAAEPTPPPTRTTTPSAPAATTTPSAPAATTTPSAPAATTTPSAPAATTTPSAPATASAPSPATTKAQTPSVTVTNARGATVTEVDDETNTTRVTERNGSTTVCVMNDATGKTLGSYTGPASTSNISVAGEHVTISKREGQTIASVDNGTSTATVTKIPAGRPSR